ncbi:pyridine nucleotide-disulfide oxidoreductase [Georgenia soli]|uniref:Pyridine nucleotide-disulfide oxidoreductase n=1 Tax=Georgenia soli TaxID=638953 RepID=A0A2A9EL20_9MICO|nr:NAD(P)-binding domain-containing protein [Georgenia soli]PFG39654.1 pyridine nucleotide-disulfide oxidoreductase [Georgenia soli]
MTTSPLSMPHAGLEAARARPDETGGPACEAVPVDLVVIGAGQAGLSAGYHLRRRGFVPALGAEEETTSRGEDDVSRPEGVGAEDMTSRAGDDVSRSHGAGTYVILDAEDGPGGAWRHRWRSLRMATVNNIYDLPGMAQPEVDPQAPSVDVLPAYFADYERTLHLGVLRPVKVREVRRANDDPYGRLLVASDAGTFAARAVINATGTWTKPFWPYYPGQESFRGRQLHVADYVSAQEFAGRHVVVVGGGISAVQLLEEISHVAKTTWVTRREPVWRDEDFDPEAGRRAVALVEERVRQGLPPLSVVSVTGLIWRPELRAAAERGVLDRHPMFTRIEPDGVRMADGSFQPADVILWATGFRAALDHLRPLHLRGRGGGITMDGTQVADEPRLHLIGYGPSSSTVGANRAGREAVTRILTHLRSGDDGGSAVGPDAAGASQGDGRNARARTLVGAGVER